MYQGLAKDHSSIEPPIWAYLLSSHCSSQNINNSIFNCESSDYTEEESINIIIGTKALVVCFVVYGQQPSASTQNMEGTIRLAEKIKQISPSQKILFVGGHVAALPQEVLKHSCVDMVCQNEGVYTISDLIKCLLAKGKLSKVTGLGYKEDNHIILNPLSL